MRTYLIQHLPGGDYDYSGYLTPEQAWECEKDLPWVEEYSNIDEARDEFISSLQSYTHEEMLEAHENGYDWPARFGFLDESESEAL